MAKLQQNSVGNHCNTATPEHVVIMENEFISDFFATQNETNNESISHGDMMRIALENSLPLEHIDVWPHRLSKGHQACDCLFETFDVLVTRANQWLEQFPQFEVITCETISKKVLRVRDIYNCEIVYTDPVDGPTPASYVLGLRLWYRLNKDPEATQNDLGKLHYFDTLPLCVHPSKKHPKYESRSQTIKRINQRLLEEPLQGPILSMETVQLKIPQEDWRLHMNIEPAHTMWFDEYNVHLLSFIRIYYRQHKHVVQQIGFEDFSPDADDEGGLFHPAKYSSFSTLLKRATNWINTATDKTVLSIKTLHAKHRRKLENKGHRFKTEAMFEKKIECRFRAFFIRVAYTFRPIPPPDHISFTRQPRLTCRTFVPVKYPENKGYENMHDMMERIGQDISAIHANVFHVETVAIPEWITDPALSESGDRTFYDGEWYFIPDQDGFEKGPFRYTLLYAIRVYFDCPPLYTELQRRISAYKLHHSCCAIM